MRTVLFKELVEVIHELPHATGIYTDMDKWRDSPLVTPLYLAGKEEEEEEDFDEQIEARGLRNFFRKAQFEDVVKVERRKHPACTIDELAAAAMYYHHYDDFRP
jgi:hypothetical protein